ncbi:unnamed protein product [Caenorhabditis sp. 36 PRJEB53466]|nr:unnamed protein product [Caenorhabditis sp. 36 PRJEB53466]
MSDAMLPHFHSPRPTMKSRRANRAGRRMTSLTANSWTLGVFVAAIIVFPMLKRGLAFGISPFIQNYVFGD